MTDEYSINGLICLTDYDFNDNTTGEFVTLPRVVRHLCPDTDMNRSTYVTGFDILLLTKQNKVVIIFQDLCEEPVSKFPYKAFSFGGKSNPYMHGLNSKSACMNYVLKSAAANCLVVEANCA